MFTYFFKSNQKAAAIKIYFSNVNEIDKESNFIITQILLQVC